MYEKHIEVLTHLAGRGWDDASAAAFDAAIELMRAAEPQDADAERVHCETMADAIVLEKSLQCRSDIRAALMRERAQARGEGHAAAIAGVGMQEFRRLEALQHATETKLKAAQAEIERLQTEAILSKPLFSRRELETKLVKLRTAAERVKNRLTSSGAHVPIEYVEALERTIEESK